MLKRRTTALLAAALILAVGVMACGPTTSPTAPPPTPLATVPPTSAPTATPTEAPPAPTPTSEPEPGWLPEGTVALYAAGSYERARLYALSADGSITDLERDIQRAAAVSPSGRWLAATVGTSPADGVVITNLESGDAYTISPPPGFEVHGMAFDGAETRLALDEVGPPEGPGTAWAIAVVDLADGTTHRFDATTDADNQFLPGDPLGWTGSGTGLLIDTFLPYSEGGFAGLWEVALPPGTPAAPFNELERRELVPGGQYSATPRLSPASVRLAYLARDWDYVPDNYDFEGYDMAVNQVWQFDLTTLSALLVTEVTDGSALARDVAWAPDGTRILFAQGTYSGQDFGALTLRIVTEDGGIDQLAPVPLAPRGSLITLAWCPGLILSVLTTEDGLHQLVGVEPQSGDTTLLAADERVHVLGCVR
jgi:hypothetical protein